MEIFERSVILRWMETTKITAVSWCYGNLFIGTNTGELCSFQSPAISEKVEYDKYIPLKICNSKILYISSLEPREELLILNSEGDLYVVNLFFKYQPVILSSKVTCIARQAVESYEGSNTKEGRNSLPMTHMANICVGSKQKIQIFSAIGEKIVHRRDVNILDIPLSICWLNNAIVVGSSRGYFMINPEGTVYNELCCNYESDFMVAGDASLDSSGDLHRKSILTASCVDNDVMVICHTIGVFYNMETMNLSQKSTIQWSDKLESLGCCPPFIIGLTSKRVLEIYGIRDQFLYQRIDQSNARFVYYMQDKGCFLTCTPNVVSALKPKSYYNHLSEILKKGKITEALNFINMYFAPSDSRRLEEIKICHTLAGWIRFSELNFPSAFQHFTFGQVDIVYLLHFWDHCSGIKYPPSYILNCRIPKELIQFVPKLSNIRKFIENSLRESTPKKNIGIQEGILQKDHEDLIDRKEKLLQIANGSFGTFLLRKIAYVPIDNDDHSATAELAEFHKKVLPSIVETTNLLLLAECDDLRYNIILKRPLSESAVDVDAAKQYLIEMNKSEIYARLLIRQGRLREAMETISHVITSSADESDYHKFKNGNAEYNDEINMLCMELASCINAAIESCTGSRLAQQLSADVDAGEFTSPEEIKGILFKYLPLLLNFSPNAALSVLTRNHAILPITTDEVLNMIDEYTLNVSSYFPNSAETYVRMKNNSIFTRNQLRIKYLEDLIVANKSGNGYENTLLLRHYIERAKSGKQDGYLLPDVEDTDEFKKLDVYDEQKKILLEFMEENYTFDLSDLGTILSQVDLLEAKILLHNKLGEHFEALEEIFTNKWEHDKISVCEAYCLCFGDVHNYDEFSKDLPYKRFFTNFEYWIQKSKELPLQEDLYEIDQKSQTSIDRLIMMLLKVIITHTSAEDTTCMTTIRNILSKYVQFLGKESSRCGQEILEIMPEDWDFAQFADFFVHLQLKAVHEKYTLSVKRSLTRALHAQKFHELSRLICTPPIKIDASSTCSVCLETLEVGMSIAMPSPSLQRADSINTDQQQHSRPYTVMHEHCAKSFYHNQS